MPFLRTDPSSVLLVAGSQSRLRSRVDLRPVISCEAVVVSLCRCAGCGHTDLAAAMNIGFRYIASRYGWWSVSSVGTFLVVGVPASMLAIAFAWVRAGRDC